MNRSIVVFLLIHVCFISMNTAQQVPPKVSVEIVDSSYMELLNDIWISTSTRSLAANFSSLVPFELPDDWHGTWGKYRAADLWPIIRSDSKAVINHPEEEAFAQAYDISENGAYEAVFETKNRTNQESISQYNIMDGEQNVLYPLYESNIFPDVHGVGISESGMVYYAVRIEVPYTGSDPNEDRETLLYENVYSLDPESGISKMIFDYYHYAGPDMVIPEYRLEGNVAPNQIDRTHFNACDDFPGEDAVIISYRHSGVWKIKYSDTHAEGMVEWVLGGPEGWAASFGFNEVAPLSPEHDLRLRLQHSASIVDSSEAFGIIYPGDILVFSNGDAEHPASRAVVIRVSSDDIAKVIWEAELGPSSFMGSVKILPLSEEEGLILVNRPDLNLSMLLGAYNDYGTDSALAVASTIGSEMVLYHLGPLGTSIVARYSTGNLNFIYEANLGFMTGEVEIDCNYFSGTPVPYENVSWHDTNGDTLLFGELNPLSGPIYFTYSKGINFYSSETTRGFSKLFDPVNCLFTGDPAGQESKYRPLVINNLVPHGEAVQLTREAEYNVYDLRGGLRASGNGVRISSGALESGAYQVRFINEDGTYRFERIIVVK